MNVISWSIMGVVVLGLGMMLMGGCGTLNREAEIRTQIEAKQKANTSDFDAMKKIIGQSAQVKQYEFDKLQEIFVKHAEARTGDGKGAIVKWVQESVPNLNGQSMDRLVSIIETHRASFNMRQKELLDYEREHRTMFRKIPGGWFLAMVGRKPLPDVMIVTSADAKQAFATGEDNDTQLFVPTQVEKK